MRAYSMDLRVRVLADRDAGATAPTTAATYRVRPAWVRRLRQRRRETGATAPRPARRRRTDGLRERDGDRIRQAIRDAPDATLGEWTARLGLAVHSPSTLWRAIADLGRTLKKRWCGRPGRTARTGPRHGRTGGRPDPTCRRDGRWSSTEPGRVPRWPGGTPAAGGASG